MRQALNPPVLILYITLSACSSPPQEPTPQLSDTALEDTAIENPDSTSTDDSGLGNDIDAGIDTWLPADTAPVEDVPTVCPEGVTCVHSFPYTEENDTSAVTKESAFDFYSCKPSADESGAEVIYQVVTPEPGFLSAAVYDEAGVDVDVHILSALDAQACLDRGHHHARTDVEAGTYYVVVDTFVKDGTPLTGPYRVDIGFTVPSQGPCNMETGIMKRVGDGGDHLVMPATGPMVLEAHLVTQKEPKPYPTTPTQELSAHYALSQATTEFILHRQQNWAPLEGGSFYGAGISSPSLFPVLHEHWYVNMYWTSQSRPDRGTRMILKLPNSPNAVVVAAGYETGPGNLENIGGTTEETHFYLGTGHKSVLTLGIAVDQSLPFGPRICDE